MCVCVCVSARWKLDMTVLSSLKRKKGSHSCRWLFQQEPGDTQSKALDLAHVLRYEENGCHCDIITIIFLQSFSLRVIQSISPPLPSQNPWYFSNLISLIFVCPLFPKQLSECFKKHTHIILKISYSRMNFIFPFKSVNLKSLKCYVNNNWRF